MLLTAALLRRGSVVSFEVDRQNEASLYGFYNRFGALRQILSRSKAPAALSHSSAALRTLFERRIFERWQQNSLSPILYFWGVDGGN
jgi:hypothetical protein